MEEQEIELIDYLNVIWRRKGLILGGTLLATVIALAVSLSMPKAYEASLTLLVTESKIPSAEGPPVKTGVSPETFHAMIRTQSIAEKTIEKFNLGSEPYRLSPRQFLNGPLSVNNVRGTNLITLQVTFSDPKLATEIANFVAEEAVRLNTALNRADTVTTREFIRQQRDTTKDVLQGSGDALVRFKETAKLEALRAEQTFLIQERGRWNRQLSDAVTELKSTRARVSQLRDELKGQQQLITLTKTVFTEPTLLAAIGEQGASRLKDLASVQLKMQEINEVYQSVVNELINSRTSEASLETRRAELERKVKTNMEHLDQVQVAVAKKEGKLDELTRNYNLAKEAYQLFAKKFEEASLLVASRVNDLKIVDRAVVPRDPVNPRVKLNVVLAGTLGLFLFTFLSFFMEYLAKVRRERSEERT